MKKYRVTIQRLVYHYAEVEMQSEGTTDCDLYEDAFYITDGLDDALFVEDDKSTDVISIELIE